MQKFTLNPVEFAITNQNLDLKNAESFGKAPRANNMDCKGAVPETNNVLRNYRMKNEIDDTVNITISCLNQATLAITIMKILLFKN